MSVRNRVLGTVGTLTTAFMLSRDAFAGWDMLNMPVGVTPISQEVYDLHMLILWICVWIGVVVFGAMFYSMIMHRKARGAEAAQFHHSTRAEILWTVVPFIILVGMAIPATKTLIFMEDTSEADVTIKITGYQWKWRYDYMNEEIGFYSNLASASRAAIYTDPYSVENYLLDVDNAMVVPVGKKVRFLITADDVIHSWWVPDLGQKKDAIPGFVNEIWTIVEKPGVYRGQCTELCGKDHGFMPIVVIAKSEDDYAKWVEEQKGAQMADAVAIERDWSKDELLARGETVYNTHCTACHQSNGMGVPGTFPAIAGSPVVTGPLEGHLRVVTDGRDGTAMRAFSSQLNEVELAAVVSYQRNAFGNETGDLLQPKQVNNGELAR